MKNLALWLGIAIALTIVPAPAAQEQEGAYRHLVPFRVERIIDGDTIAGVAAPWPGVRIEVSVRLDGIDTPETRGGCEESRALAQKATLLTARIVSAAEEVDLVNPHHGQYAGRVVAVVLADGVDVGALLVEAELARPYDGRTRRPSWCEEPVG